MKTKDGFIAWLQGQMKEREWSNADLSRQSGISQAQISNVLNEMRDVGPEFARGIANAFGLPQRSVFVLAGLMDDDESPPQPKNKLLARLLQEAGELDDADIELMADQVQYTWKKRAQRIKEQQQSEHQPK
jgi:transcriptional regulator with XRE-family HTH domain